MKAHLATVLEASVAGRDLPTNGPYAGWDFGFHFHGAAANGVEVRLVLDQHTRDLTLQIADRTNDLDQVPGFTAPPRGRVLVIPEVSVTRLLRF